MLQNGAAVAALIISSLASLVAFIATVRQFTKGYIERRMENSQEHNRVKMVEKNLRAVMRHLGLPWDDE